MRLEGLSEDDIDSTEEATLDELKNSDGVECTLDSTNDDD